MTLYREGGYLWSRGWFVKALSVFLLFVTLLAGPVSPFLVYRYFPFLGSWPLWDVVSLSVVTLLASAFAAFVRRANQVRADIDVKARLGTVFFFAFVAGGFWLLTSSLCVVYDRLVGASISECREGVEIYTMGTQGRSPTYIRDVKSNELIFEFRSLFIEIPRERGVYPAVEFEYRQGRWVKVLVAVRPLVSCSSN